jgi:hypothetical protein
MDQEPDRHPVYSVLAQIMLRCSKSSNRKGGARQLQQMHAIV